MNRRLSLVAQKMFLDRLYPESTSRIERSQLCWRGILQPTDLSRAYAAKLAYKAKMTPMVHVVHPKLVPPEGEKLPHVYPGDRLCLYLPRTAEWTADMRLAETIIPWASEWLLFYELWLATGEWMGGGEHPNSGDGTKRPDLASRPSGRSTNTFERRRRR